MAPPDINGMHTLKVDNVTYRSGPEDIKRLFCRYGEIGDVYIPRNRDTGESRGFAFVRFIEQRDAEDAISGLDGKEYEGRELRIQFAKQRRPDNPREFYRDRDSSRRGMRGGGRRRSSSPRSYRSNRSPPRRRDSPPRRARSRSPRPSRSRSNGRWNPRRSRSRSFDRRGGRKSRSRDRRDSRDDMDAKSRSRSPARRDEDRSRSASRSKSPKEGSESPLN